MKCTSPPLLHLLISTLSHASAYHAQQGSLVHKHGSLLATSSGRRGFLRSAGGFVAGAGLSSTFTALGAFAEDGPDVDVYFGCGCFWHVQHEFVEAERRLLSRKGDLDVTALTGYAGGAVQADKGSNKVCYHNMMKDHEYSALGHAEAVALRIPPSSFQAFAEVYFNLFDERGDRPDQMGDRGGEYRNVVGIPGGVSGPFYAGLLKASLATGDRLDLSKGRGSDGDARANVWVMDSQAHPFHVAEPYHQFHDGFKAGEDYPESYNSLTKKQLKGGAFTDSKCPSGLIGLGVAGL